MFGLRARDRQRRIEADAFRHGLVDQGIQVGDADGSQHGGDFVGVGSDVTGDEIIALFEGGEGALVMVWAAISGMAGGGGILVARLGRPTDAGRPLRRVSGGVDHGLVAGGIEQHGQIAARGGL